MTQHKIIYQSQLNDGFKIVTRRGRYKVGSGNGDKNFHGRENKDKKIRLFIFKVPDSVTEKDITSYIKTRTGTENAYVKKLDTRKVRINIQSFMLGIEPQLLQHDYEPSFLAEENNI